MNHEKIRLRNREEVPTDERLQEALGGSYGAYEAFVEDLGRYDIEQEWQWYTPHKAWYAKGQHYWTTVRGTRKEKNLYWLHVFEGCFVVAVWFKEKNRSEVLREQVSDKTKRLIQDAEATMNMSTFPVLFEVTGRESIADIYTLIGCKKRLEA